MFSATTVGPTIKTSPKRCSAYCDIFQWAESPELVAQEADKNLGFPTSAASGRRLLKNSVPEG